jgi:hypothetical protein
VPDFSCVDKLKIECRKSSNGCLVPILLKKLFQHHFRQNFWSHQTPNRVALVDCRASYEVSVFEAVALQQPIRVFQHDRRKTEDRWFFVHSFNENPATA